VINYKITGVFTTSQGEGFAITGHVMACKAKEARAAMLATLRRNGYDITHESIVAEGPKAQVVSYSLEAVK